MTRDTNNNGLGIGAAIGRRAALRLTGAALLALAAGCRRDRAATAVIGSKNFTEQILLGELLAQQIEAHTALRADRRFDLGGTLICQQALLSGQMDAYVEYTGTALAAVLHEPLAPTENVSSGPAGVPPENVSSGAAAGASQNLSGGSSAAIDPAEVYRRVRDDYRSRFNLVVGPLLGFNNTFAIVVRGDDARRYNLHTVSDIVPLAPHWRAGFGYEFMEREDGYRGWARTYGLQFASQPRIMDLGLLYRALEEKQVDVVAGNSTDGLILALGMQVLGDDRRYFPPYQAVPVVRAAALELHPELRALLDALGGKISDDEMRQMNYAVDGQQRDPATVVRAFRRAKNL